jgi:hypothetical protein
VPGSPLLIDGSSSGFLRSGAQVTRFREVKAMSNICSLKMVGRLLTVFGVFALAVCLAWLPGRMTGGGSVFQGPNQVDSAQVDNSNRVTHGFEIHCGSDANPSTTHNNLEINWGSPGDKHRFHLDDTLVSADCSFDPNVGSPNPPPAGFNTFVGDGTGKLDGQSGATIHFVFTDAGEPGGTNGTPPPDTAAYLITDSTGTVVLNVPATALTFGNQQAHAQ